MFTLSLCMIVKNEEKNLDKCLSSIFDVVNEIIIVDTGSIDKTIEIAKKYNARIYNFKWINDFSKARNYSFEKATCDYIMWLDADDYITRENKEKLKEKLKLMTGNEDCIYLKYVTGFSVDNTPNFYFFRERIVKRARKFLWYECVHEHLKVLGNLIKWDVSIYHSKKEGKYSVRNLNIYRNLEKNDYDFTTRALYYYGTELNNHGYKKEAIEKFNTFLNKSDCFKEDGINTCLYLADLYEQQDDIERAIDVLFYSFKYDIPRAEICCRIGSLILKKLQYNMAIYWYLIASKCEIPDTIGFIRKEYFDFVPFIELSVIYDLLNNKEEAIRYHELAKKISPNHPSVILNEKYFYMY